MSKDASIPTTVWCRADQVQLASDVAKAAGLKITHAGSSERGRGIELAEGLGAEPIDDLRAAIASANEGLVWILDPGSFGSTEDDAAALLTAHSRGVRVSSLEPVPASALELTEAWTVGHVGVRAVDTIRVGPLLSRMPSLNIALENREALGPVRTIGIELLSRPEQGSLGARLVSALEFLISEFGVPELIDAAFVGPRTESGLHEIAGESLRGLSGDLTLSLRFTGGQAASVLCSNHAGAWSQSVTLLGQGGRLSVNDDGFDWLAPDGALVDQHRSTPRPAKRAMAVHTITVEFAELLRANPNAAAAPAAPPIDPGPVLAAAQTALLSCRTGQAENPGTITRMMLW